MPRFAILTDSSADLPDRLVRAWEVEVLPLSFRMGDADYRDCPDRRDMDPEEFYDRMRRGETAVTSAVNPEDFSAAVLPHLERGEDVLILAFSSGLSATCQSALLAAAELEERFPGRTVRVVDTLCASLGQGLLVGLAAEQRGAGKTLEETARFAEETRLRVCHWFTVDDLRYLKRGGRVSAATALVGSMLSIKPVMHVDDAGRLVNVDRARGRRAAVQALADRMGASAVDPAGQRVFISHGGCREDAEHLAELVKGRFGVRDVVISAVGPVIGAHSGPGTLALFFLGRER